MRTVGFTDISATTTPQRVQLGKDTGPFTLTAGAQAVYYRADARVALDAATGTGAALRALGCSLLAAGGSVVLDGSAGILDIVQATGGTGSTCTIDGGELSGSAADTALLTTIDADTGSIATAVQAATAARTSTLYTGNGTTGKELQDNQAATALLETADHVAEVISVGSKNVLDLQIINATATETITLSVREYSAATPTLATLIRVHAVATGADQAQTVDRSCVGLVTGTAYYAKTPVRVTVTPGAYVVLAIIENITGLAYARYQLLGSV